RPGGAALAGGGLLRELHLDGSAGRDDNALGLGDLVPVVLPPGAHLVAVPVTGDERGGTEGPDGPCGLRQRPVEPDLRGGRHRDGEVRDVVHRRGRGREGGRWSGRRWAHRRGDVGREVRVVEPEVIVARTVSRRVVIAGIRVGIGAVVGIDPVI